MYNKLNVVVTLCRYSFLFIVEDLTLINMRRFMLLVPPPAKIYSGYNLPLHRVRICPCIFHDSFTLTLAMPLTM